MEFGVQFFPPSVPIRRAPITTGARRSSSPQLAEQLGFTNVRTVEHYFLSYGGYGPDPLIFSAPPRR